jgi:hypothetical protein
MSSNSLSRCKISGEFFFLAGFLLLFLVLNDHLIASKPFFSSQVWALYDGVVHGLVGVLILFPLYKEKINRYFVILFLLAAVVDIDHFIAAQSLYLADALRLPMRPLTHSITFAVLAAGGGFLLTRDRIVGWSLFAAVTSHVIRDASGGGTPLFWPLEIYRIPSWLYYGGEIVLLHFSFQLSQRQRYKCWTK